MEIEYYSIISDEKKIYDISEKSTDSSNKFAANLGIRDLISEEIDIISAGKFDWEGAALQAEIIILCFGIAGGIVYLAGSFFDPKVMLASRKMIEA